MGFILKEEKFDMRVWVRGGGGGGGGCLVLDSREELNPGWAGLRRRGRGGAEASRGERGLPGGACVEGTSSSTALLHSQTLCFISLGIYIYIYIHRNTAGHRCRLSLSAVPLSSTKCFI